VYGESLRQGPGLGDRRMGPIDGYTSTGIKSTHSILRDGRPQSQFLVISFIFICLSPYASPIRQQPWWYRRATTSSQRAFQKLVICVFSTTKATAHPFGRLAEGCSKGYSRLGKRLQRPSRRIKQRRKSLSYQNWPGTRYEVRYRGTKLGTDFEQNKSLSDESHRFRWLRQIAIRHSNFPFWHNPLDDTAG
jgi:hypothetical protein